MTANTYWDLVLAYGVFWTVLALFLVRIQRNQSRLREELDAIERVLADERERDGTQVEIRRVVGG